MKVIDTIEYDLPLLYNTNSVFEAIEWCEQYHSKYAFVSNENKNILGYVSLNQLYEFDQDILLNDVFLQKYTYKIYSTSHLFELFKIISSIDNFVLPIIDINNIILGFSSAEKILQAYILHNQVLNEGGIIVLTLQPKNYSLSEIARIVESNDANILNVSLSYNQNSKLLDVAISINKTDLKAIEASFERYNYIVSQIVQQSNYDSQIQNRIDNLIKYIEI